MRWGYTCSSEEFEASDLIRFAGHAEDAGFEFVTVSDHVLAHEIWPDTAIAGQFSQDLPTWPHFDQGATMLDGVVVS